MDEEYVVGWGKRNTSCSCHPDDYEEWEDGFYSLEEAMKKAPAKNKAVKVTATDQILKIISRSKKGVDTATLMKKTGFNQKKVTNILQRTFKAGKIKRAAKGIYIGA